MERFILSCIVGERREIGGTKCRLWGSAFCLYGALSGYKCNVSIGCFFPSRVFFSSLFGFLGVIVYPVNCVKVGFLVSLLRVVYGHLEDVKNTANASNRE